MEIFQLQNTEMKVYDTHENICFIIHQIQGKDLLGITHAAINHYVVALSVFFIHDT